MSSPERPLVRLVVRVLAPVTAIGATLMTLPAHADVPVGWSEPEAVSPLAFLLVVLGAPVALVLLIAVVVMAPGFTRGEGMTGKGEHDDDQWFGGRKQRVSELDSGGSDPRALPGGASGSW